MRMYPGRYRRFLTGLATVALLPGLAAAEPDDGAGNGGAATASMLTPAASSLLIGSITIDNGNIFDPELPDEDRFLFHLANRLHMRTRPDVIEQQLLFEPGETFDRRTLEETERILRANRFLRDVDVETLRNEDDRVDIVVHTRDTWTLVPKVSFSRKGGANSSAFGMREMNLLGSGASVELMFASDVDRDYRTFRWLDPHLGSSWLSSEVLLEDNSDGSSSLVRLERPFYALDSRRAWGVTAWDNDEIQPLYDAGEAVDEFRRQRREFEVFRGWSRGLEGNSVTRFKAGLAFEESLFSATDASLGPLPADRRFVYPWIGVEWLEDRFATTRNMDQLSETEDVFLGARLGLRLGYAAPAFGSDAAAWLIDASAERGFGDPEHSALLLASGLRGRIAGGDAENLVLDASARYFHRQSEHRLLTASLALSVGQALDRDAYLELGGDSGLRGYPLRYQSGDRRAILTVEQRFFSDWYPFRLFHVGGAVFADIGRAWGESPAGRSDDEWLRDVGFGLRIGSSRSGMGRMTHLDVALPLDGNGTISDVQFLVTTRKSF